MHERKAHDRIAGQYAYAYATPTQAAACMHPTKAIPAPWTRLHCNCGAWNGWLYKDVLRIRSSAHACHRSSGIVRVRTQAMMVYVCMLAGVRHVYDRHVVLRGILLARLIQLWGARLLIPALML